MKLKSRLTLLTEKVKKDKHDFWLSEYKCACGNITFRNKNRVDKGDIKSCGCYRKDGIGTTHGLLKNNRRLYNIWLNMKNRCLWKGHNNYHLYGGRGIKICEDWKNYFPIFHKWCMGNGYSDLLSLDRINGNGNYEPSNCRWVDQKTQSRNRSNTIKPENVILIKQMLKAGKRNIDIAKIFNIYPKYVSNIKLGKYYADVKFE